MQRPKLPERRIRCSKQMAKMIMKAERELNAEGVTQLALVNLSCAISLTSSWGWSLEKVKELFDREEKILEKCSNDRNLSLISMFDEECNIELTNREGVSYKDFGYLNIEKDKNDYTAPQWLQMRKNQKQWLGAMFTAAMGLALHQFEGWDEDEIAKLIQETQGIKEECNYNMKIMSEYAKDKVNFDIAELKLAA